MAITYGMSVKEFWEENPDLFWAYRFSYYERKKLNEREKNFELWLQGAYFFDAVSVALANSFGKGNKVHKYAEKPYCLTKEDEEEEKKKEKERLETQIKNRISQVQALLGKNNNKKKSTTKKGKGGEKQK